MSATLFNTLVMKFAYIYQFPHWQINIYVSLTLVLTKLPTQNTFYVEANVSAPEPARLHSASNERFAYFSSHTKVFTTVHAQSYLLTRYVAICGIYRPNKQTRVNISTYVPYCTAWTSALIANTGNNSGIWTFANISTTSTKAKTYFIAVMGKRKTK